MNKTKIEYLTHSWSPIAMRCTPVSEGCKNCWHLAMADRLAKNPMIPEDRQKAYAGGEPVLIEKELSAPTRLKKPAIIGTQFMGDLFHEDVPFKFIRLILFNMYGGGRHHTYLILTKRPERMLDFFMYHKPNYWPLFNVYLGITAENQQLYDKRWEILRQIPAAVRFVSIEPMLSKIDLKLYDYCESCGSHSVRRYFLNWVICGCESGPRRRPAKTEWVRNLRDQCIHAHVPFFLKQLSIENKVSHDPDKWPEALKIRKFPNV